MRNRVPTTWGKGRGRAHLPYLLIESDDPVLAISDFNAFLEAGFNPAFCTGPAPGRPCPLLQVGRCELIDEADVVLNRMYHDTGLAGAVRSSRPDVPLVVVASRPDGDLPPTATVGTQMHVLRREVYRGKTRHPAAGVLGD